MDVVGIINLIETFANWNSSDKLATGISIFIQYDHNICYGYTAYADSDLMFTEYSSGFTGCPIDEEAPAFQLFECQ